MRQRKKWLGLWCWFSLALGSCWRTTSERIRTDMRVKTNELSGKQLDYAVGRCRGLTLELHGVVPYSTDWVHGGLVIEQEKIGVWWATHYVDDEGQEYGNHWYAETAESLVGCGETPLVAAMRCYVASKLGEEVEVPDGL